MERNKLCSNFNMALEKDTQLSKQLAKSQIRWERLLTIICMREVF